MSRDVHRAVNKNDVMEFVSPNNPERRIRVNLNYSTALIVGRPNTKELIAFVRRIEKAYIEAFWENLLCAESPYHPVLPFGLASWKSTRNIIDPQPVIHKLSAKYEVPYTKPPLRYFELFDFEQTKSAINELRPVSIRDAEKLLLDFGKERFDAWSVLDYVDAGNDFDATVAELALRAADHNRPGSKFSCFVLVALRTAGWVVLPFSVVARIAQLDGSASKYCRAWESPMRYLSGELRSIVDGLTPPAKVRNLSTTDESMIRYATLCTSVRNLCDFSWPLAAQILRRKVGEKQLSLVNYSAELKEHWREICRQNLSAASGLSRLISNTGTATSKVLEKLDDWRIEPQGSPAALNREEFLSGRGDGSTIILNLDESQFINLQHISKPGVTALVRTVEAEYVRAFWEVLTRPSKFQTGLPHGLSATPNGHTLIPAITVYQQLTGYSDMNSSESKNALLRYPIGEIQRAIWQLMPTSVQDARSVLSENGRWRLKGTGLLPILSKSTCFHEFVQEVYLLATQSGHNTQKALAQSAVVAMRSKMWIVLPASVVRHIGTVLRGVHSSKSERSFDPMRMLSGNVMELHEELLGDHVPQSRQEQGYRAALCRYAILCTNLRDSSDLSMPLVQRILSTARTSLIVGRIGCPWGVRSAWRRLCEANGPGAMTATATNDHNEELRRRCTYDIRLDKWVQLLADHCDQHLAGNYEPLYQAFGTWLTWLSSRSLVPTPHEVTRSQIVGPSDRDLTFLEFLSDLKVGPDQKNLCLKKMHSVFDDLVSESELAGTQFTNPIRYDRDRFSTPRNMKRDVTSRSRLPSLVLEELKLLIVEGTEQSGYRWSNSLRQIRYIFEGGKSKNKELGVMCPILPAVLYFMLVFPLRTHQVRWLDSGEMDSYVYDFAERSFKLNESRFIKGRQSGVIQAANGDISPESSHLDFQVAVNKTALSERSRSAFTIPYLPPDVLWVLAQVISWQKLYGPAAHLVKEVHEPVNKKRRNQSLSNYYPDICPLFRYPAQKSFYPPTHAQIAYFWGDLCRVYDEKNASKDPVTGGAVTKPGVPILSRQYVGPKGNRWDVANFDLHSLRVAGVSELLDAGLPLAVVAAVAGHKSIAMTLYYYRAENDMLRLKLHEAMSKLGKDSSIAEIARQLTVGEKISWLRGSRDALAKLQANRKTGLLSITISGICPGTSCNDGLSSDILQSNPSPVPGSKCPLCKYYVYGPPFLPGLVYDFNCLLFELQHKAEQQVEIRAALITAEDAGQTSEMWRLRGEDERLDREAGLDVAVLARLHDIINESLTVLNQVQDHGSNLQLLSREPRLSASVSQVSRFEALKEILEVSHALPGTRQIAPVFAQLELKDLLLNVLRKNGVDCYLAGLSGKESAKATIQLARLLEALIPTDDQRERLLDGLAAISEFSMFDQAVKSLTAANAVCNRPDQVLNGITPQFARSENKVAKRA